MCEKYYTLCFPENDPGLFEGLRGIAPQRLGRIPDNDLVRGNAHLVGGVLSEVLIGKKEDLLTLGEPPAEGLARIGRSADNPPACPQKALMTASEFMYVTGMTFSAGTTASSSSHAR